MNENPEKAGEPIPAEFRYLAAVIGPQVLAHLVATLRQDQREADAQLVMRSLPAGYYNDSIGLFLAKRIREGT